MRTGLLTLLNLALLILLPVSWAAPLMRAGVLPLFSLTEVSVLTGLQALWRTDVFLAALVTLFAVVAPYGKTVALALMHFEILSLHALPVLRLLGKLAMAEVFLLALYIVLIKGTGFGRIEVGWGLYLFTACVLASLGIGWATKQSDAD